TTRAKRRQARADVERAKRADDLAREDISRKEADTMRVPIQRQNDFPSTILSEVDLDESVERVRSAAARARRDVHDLGVALKDIQDRQLWKLRLDKEGKPSYRHFKDFLKAEI